jgi:hypothetical protein
LNWFWIIRFYFDLNLNNTYYSNQIKSFDTLSKMQWFICFPCVTCVNNVNPKKITSSPTWPPNRIPHGIQTVEQFILQAGYWSKNLPWTIVIVTNDRISFLKIQTHSQSVLRHLPCFKNGLLTWYSSRSPQKFFLGLFFVFLQNLGIIYPLKAQSHNILHCSIMWSW